MRHPFAMFFAVSWNEDDIDHLKAIRKSWARMEQDTFPEEKALVADLARELIRDVKKNFKELRKQCQRMVKVYSIVIRYMEGDINGVEADFPAELHDDILMVFSQALDRECE